jgi:hypothetical protein
MARPFRSTLLAAAALAAALPLSAQEPWDACFRLGVLRASGLRDDRLSQDTGGVLAAAGAYPVTRRGWACFEVGYRRLMDLSMTPATGTRTLDRLDGYFVGAGYRHALPVEGVYAQAGLRLAAHRAFHRDILVGAGSGGSDQWNDTRGAQKLALEPVLSLGARFSTRNSVELAIGRASFEDAFGVARGKLLVELSLAVHL